MLLGRMELNDPINSAKYTLRTKSILKRIESERTRHTNSRKKDTKEKEKPAPLSKYRRKTANARERNRMKEINDAFISLQSSLPDIPGTDTDKLTKITVLKLAVNYISALSKVLDNSSPSMDVEEVRELWCHDNAHITKGDHCVKSVVKSQGTTKKVYDSAKPLSTSETTPKTSSTNKKRSTVSQRDDNLSKDKYLHSIKPTIKKPGKSRTRGKVCRTNSVATNNGAYITLKNCAMQTTHNSKFRAINNQPVMMSMTVKRTRMEPVVGHRSIKMRKYEPQLSYGTTDLVQYNPISPRLNRNSLQYTTQINKSNNCRRNLNNELYDNRNSSPSLQYQFNPLHTVSPQKTFTNDRLSPLYNNNENMHHQNKINHPHSTHINFSPIHTSTDHIQKSNYNLPATDNMQYLSAQTNPESYPMGGLTFSDLKSPSLRNDVLLDFPRQVKQSSPADSAFSSGESAPSSPTLSLHSTSPALEDLSPFNSLTSSLSGVSTDSACSISNTDCESVFNSILDSAPFQEELDYFASNFSTDNSNSFNLLIDQQTPSFGNCDIDSY